MCYFIIFEKKKDFEKKLILITFNFSVKIDFFGKISFVKTLNKHFKMTKMTFFI